MQSRSLFEKLKDLVPARLRPLSFCKRFLLKYTNQTVHSGPFKGMKYLSYTLTGAYFAKLLGTYEKELTAALESLRKINFNQIAVVGSGEGYYPVGLSSYFNAPVVAYERNEESEKAIEELSSMNGTNAPDFLGTCTPESLENVNKSLIFMDIEGEEIEFLNSGVVNRLASSYWIIEIHGISVKDQFIRQLNSFFKMEFIPVQPRTMKDFPLKMNRLFRWALSRYWKSLMQEWRGKDEGSSIGWLILAPKENPS